LVEFQKEVRVEETAEFLESHIVLMLLTKAAVHALDVYIQNIV